MASEFFPYGYIIQNIKTGDILAPGCKNNCASDFITTKKPSEAWIFYQYSHCQTWIEHHEGVGKIYSQDWAIKPAYMLVGISEGPLK